jgi:hypothetical protein
MTYIAAVVGVDGLDGYRFRFGIKHTEPNCIGRLAHARWPSVEQIKSKYPRIEDVELGQLCWDEAAAIAP